MANIRTILRNYRFDIREPAQSAAYLELCETLKATAGRGHCMESHGGASHWINELGETRAIELETKFLFENQWNTAPIDGFSEKGYRVFDWAQDYQPNNSPYIKRGHYLDITSEMIAIRANMMKCRYCGAMEPAQKGYTFCPHCTDSAYLTQKDLHLTRMMAVSDTSKCAPLTDAESAYLLPIYKKAQIEGNTARGIARIKKERADTLSHCEKIIKNATIERDGKIWLMDHAINTENVIYYNHTGRFSFGWRSPIADCLKSELLDVISEFPFDYDIICADGSKLSS